MSFQHIKKPKQPTITKSPKKNMTDSPIISHNQYDAIHQLHTIHGNQYVTRMLQRQEMEEVTPVDHEDPRADAPDLWSPEQFQKKMRYFDNRAGDWIDWVEHEVTGYDEDLAKIQELLGEYQAAKDAQEPEVVRQKKLFDLIKTLQTRCNQWMAKNPDSSRAAAIGQLVNLLQSARTVVTDKAKPYLGSEYVLDSTVDLDYSELHAVDLHLQDMIAKTEGTEDKAALESNLAQIRSNLGDKVNDLFKNFPAEILSNPDLGIPKETNDRIEFLEYMASYLGSVDKAVEHFSNIRRAQVPGEVWMHDSAATRLEGVKDDLGGFDMMPSSSVALGVRGRFRVHSRNSNSRMAHPLGYAIDYRPTVNQMLTGRNFDLANLDARMQSGNKNERITMNLGSSSNRRGLIADMGNGTANEEAVEKFDAALNAEFERVSNLSDNFGSALGADAGPKLLKLNEERTANEKSAKSIGIQISKIQKNIDKLAKKKNPTADETAQLTTLSTQLQELQTQQTQLQQEHYQIWQGIQAILAPYIEQIEKEQAELGAEVKGQVDKKLGEGVMLLTALETGIKQDLDNIIAVEAGENETETLKAYETFFKNYTDSYAQVATTAQDKLSDEERYRSNKNKMKVYFQQNLNTLNELQEKFTTLRPMQQVKPRGMDGAEVDSNNESDAPAISGHLLYVLDQTKSTLFNMHDKIIEKQQAKENSKLTYGRNWRTSGQREYSDLAYLKNSLMWDAKFLFVNQDPWGVRNSSLVNTLEKGYFNADEGNIENPNPENEKTTREHREKGFNLEFIRAMAKRGFDLGVAWSTSTDAMHFELVDGVDSLPGRNDVQAELDKALIDLRNRGVLPMPEEN